MEYICNGSTYTFDKGYIALPLTVEGLPETIVVGGERFTIKSKHHVSLAHAKGIAEKYALPDGEKKITELFCEFTTNHDVSFVRYTGEFRLARSEERKSVVALCEVSHIKDFPAFLKERLGIEVPNQPTHVTLYTLVFDVGIGLNSLEELAAKSSVIEAPAELSGVLC